MTTFFRTQITRKAVNAILNQIGAASTIDQLVNLGMSQDEASYLVYVSQDCFIAEMIATQSKENTMTTNTFEERNLFNSELADLAQFCVNKAVEYETTPSLFVRANSWHGFKLMLGASDYRRLVEMVDGYVAG